jgi:hypothetical protein
MRRFTVSAGLVCAAVDTALMAPLTFSSSRDKRVAMTAAFIERFVLGLSIGPVTRALGGPGLLIGPAFALAASIPTALTTGSWGPVLGVGVLNGLAVGAAYDQLHLGGRSIG